MEKKIAKKLYSTNAIDSVDSRLFSFKLERIQRDYIQRVENRLTIGIIRQNAREKYCSVSVVDIAMSICVFTISKSIRPVSSKM